MQAAVGLAVIKYNHGSTVFQHVLREMGCIESSSTAAGLAKADDEHMYFAKRKHSSEEKESRKHRRRQRKGLVEDAVDAEGTTYACGGF